MCDPSQQQKGHGSKPYWPSTAPNNREKPQAYSHRHVEVEEAHVENKTIGKHGDARQDKPQASAASAKNKQNCSPGKYQNTEGYGYFLREVRTHPD